MIKEKKNLLIVFTGAAFTFFLLIACYKLTNASLWGDETTEYWYSKTVFGQLPWDWKIGSLNNMYERIVSTYQPPLYNALMYFWLKVSDTEWWFRFFGVLIGFLGMVGLYKTIYKLTNPIIASFSIIFSASVYQLVYYWQEAAEYCLMLGALFWAIYYWICLLQGANFKNIGLFTILSVIVVYSQYGGVFPIIAMALVAIIHVIMTKDKRNIVYICICDVLAIICGAIPLWFLFLKKQMLNQQGGNLKLNEVIYSEGFITDFFANLKTVFKWNFISYYGEAATEIISVVCLLLILIVFFVGNNKLTKKIILGNCLCWVLYYFATKFGLYASGIFGVRYNVFFIPMWIVLFFAVSKNCFDVLENIDLQGIEHWYTGICICFALCYIFYSWESVLQDNWQKEDNRGVVEAWYTQEAYEKETIIYYASGSPFAYYVRQNENFDDRTEQNVHYMPWLRNMTVHEYENYINEIYGGYWPDDIYVVATHYQNDLNIFLENFINRGYAQENAFVTYGGKLIHLVKKVK